MHLILFRKRPFSFARLSALFFSFVVLSCDFDKSVESGTCTPSCNDRCGLEDGCGGVCDCSRGNTSSKCNSCSPREICIGDRCVCVPNCDGSHERDDGCGGTCTCPDGKAANAAGNCVDETECVNTCNGSGWECGSLCGKSCGSCAASKSCDLGQCVCEPLCDGTSCDDGCGGTCPCPDGSICNGEKSCVPEHLCSDTCKSLGAVCGQVCGNDCGVCGPASACSQNQCAEAVSCEECPLQLRLINKEISGDKIQRVVLSIKYLPRENDPRPRMIDLRIRASKSAVLENVELGKALADSGKSLYRDPATDDPWKVRHDGSVQMMAFSVGDIEEIVPGNLVTLTYGVSDDASPVFSLVKRGQTFAPGAPDMALQGTDYDRPITVTR